MAAAKVLREWTHLLSGDGGAAIVQRMQDRLVGGDFLDEEEDSNDDGRNFYEGLTGGEDECEFDGDPDGAGRLRYPNDGFELEGAFRRGLKQGRGRLKNADQTFVLDGFFHSGLLVGNAIVKFGGGSSELFFCRRGKKRGLSRRVDSDGRLSSVGIYATVGGGGGGGGNSKRRGVWWRRMDGGGWMVTDGDAAPFHNDKGSDKGQRRCQRQDADDAALFLYPDLASGFCGRFCRDSEKAVSGKHFSVIGVTEKWSVLCPIVDAAGDALDLEAPVEQGAICRYPTVRDPYESRTVEVRESRVPGAGEGLFAVRDVGVGESVAYFAGVRVPATETSARSDYSILLGDGETALDVPPHLRSTQEYCASLGHKVCHSFSPNAAYSHAAHPLFGRIRSISAVRPIAAGDEVTCDYKYNWERAPDWYKEALERFLLEEKGISPDKVKEWARTRTADNQGKDV